MSDQEARSTDRPPAPEEDAAHDLAKAIRAAKTNASPGRYGPPQATAKIRPFELAQALALSSADGDHPPGSSKPPRDDDAPFVAGEVEVVGEEEVPSGITGDSKPPSHTAKSAAPEPVVVPPRPRHTGLVILGLVVGCIVIVYAYVTANH